MSNNAGFPGSDLKVAGLDFLKSQNCRLHHTDAYNTSNLVVRRGQPFQLQLTFSRELQAPDKLSLRFSIGENPMRSRGTLMSLNPRREEDLSRWQISILKSSGKECLLSVTSSPMAPVGKYTLNIKTGNNIYKPENSEVYLLFNPWCEDDVVFMADEAQRKEYVLNDTGYIYIGSAYSIYNRPWNFGQFEEFILDACMYLLDKSKLKLSNRRDPIFVSRAMSALVNANDDSGVLLGNWSGNYNNGTSPLDWIGSVSILQKYYKTKQPVLYGQCWVFAGVLTTVMRCLGIPSRCVSNFNSAHDTEENLRVDIYLNELGEKLNGMSLDSVWNFHVWNDVWMKRTDLPAGFDGWQAIDSTPQEQSQGIFQCGPCPLKAIREGDVYLPFDSKFVYAEVNADKVYWVVKKVNGKDKYIRINTETRGIGMNISTKAVGQDKREDITWQYKFPEGSEEERKSMQKASSFIRPSGIMPRARFASSLPAGHVDPKPTVLQETVSKSGLQLEITSKAPLYPGNPFELAIMVKTSTPGTWTINLASSCQLQSYTGKVEASLGHVKETVKLEGKSEVQVPLNIAADAYMKTLASVEDEVLIHITAIAEVQGTDDKLTKEMTMSFEYPPITVQMPETAKLNKEFTCAFIFKNKLNVPLDNCKLLVEGLGIFKMSMFDQGDVKPGRIIKSEIICTPTRLGEKKIVAKLTSNQIKAICTEKAITIVE
ncbi:protein-glutamine gamma-glutamyltransferase 4 [Pezoporus flaviventris]|uniref:protein-glutamine gamma-glutamyltransferase 4 n=1 Tax=Pezoporus flaviventris TaxID=889875 RepID=UPI002AB07FF0|nr:protein-glutamine gamma-glutamyltransferase 4 [Pezoporus flaviventris]XP_061320475.1 protein-glutamine gamma-glutamyltransferase 4 [Pezoporus flaviventris]